MASQRLDADRLAAAYERDGRRLLIFFTRRTYDAQLAIDLVGETYARFPIGTNQPSLRWLPLATGLQQRGTDTLSVPPIGIPP